MRAYSGIYVYSKSSKVQLSSEGTHCYQQPNQQPQKESGN